MSETRYQRVAREQRERQEARAKRETRRSIAGGRWRSGAYRDRTRKRRSEESFEDRLDDLSESPDF
jgi:hypothetical protein